MGGTSTGGIICLALNSENPDTGAIYTASNILDKYRENADQIFKRRQDLSDDMRKLIDWLGLYDKDGPGFFETQYSDGIDDFLEKIFGKETYISELTTDCNVSVCSYDLTNGKPYYFNNIRAQEEEEEDYLVWQVAKATSAAPTFFPGASIKNLSGEERKFIDGGVVINNPTLMLYNQARILHPEAKIEMLSLGTGEVKKIYDLGDDAGASAWYSDLIEIMMRGQSQIAEVEMLALSSLYQSVYYRWQQELKDEIQLDATKTEMINKLLEYGDILIKNENVTDICKTWRGKSQNSIKLQKQQLIIEVQYIEGNYMEKCGEFTTDDNFLSFDSPSNIYVYRPSNVLIEKGWKWVGHTASSPLDSKYHGYGMIVKELVDNQEVFKDPKGFEQIWTDEGSRRSQSFSAWRIIPPEGYEALGALLRFGKDNYNEPSGEEIKGLVCVKKEFTVEAKEGGTLWSDAGSGASKDITLWKLIPLIKEQGIIANTFLCYGQKREFPPGKLAELCIKRVITRELSFERELDKVSKKLRRHTHKPKEN